MRRLRACVLAICLGHVASVNAQSLTPEQAQNVANTGAYKSSDPPSNNIPDFCSPASRPLQELDTDALSHALISPSREVTDYLRDETRKPVQTLDFLGLKRGMRVLDLYAAGGYYTFILSKAVGENGCVIAQNTQRGRAFIEDRQAITQGEALDTKIRAGNLSNVRQLIAPTTALGLAPESLDFILLTLTLHDYANPNPERAKALLATLYSLLRSGGILGVSDHIGDTGNNNSALHRMPQEQAVALAQDAGFEVTTSDLLSVHTDDHSRSIFDPRLARNTDRFLLRLQKPAR